MVEAILSRQPVVSGKKAINWLKIAVLAAPLALFSQNPAPFRVTEAGTRILVDSLTRQINRFYVEKEAASRMSAQIRKKLREGRYKGVTDPHLLAGMLTRDLLAVHRDEHLHVEYNPVMSAEISGNIEDVPRMVAEKLELERNRNFGFRKVEILSGNIGFLEISSFSRLNQYSKAAADAAMKLLSNSRALIIDLRYGVGGSPEMVTHLLGYFFKDRTHITDIYIRSENATLPYWTTPDSATSSLTRIPIYVLTSYKTFSAAEGFIYALKTLKRATIVGETTRGGAHTVSYRALGNGFICDIPFGKAISPVTGTNWEGTGIAPDIAVSPDEALEAAELKFFESSFAAARDSGTIKLLKWQFQLLQSVNHPVALDSGLTAQYAGKFGAYELTRENGVLYYQKAGKARFPLVPMNNQRLRPKGNDSFIVEISRDSSGKASRITTFYDDGRVETAVRTE